MLLSGLRGAVVEPHVPTGEYLYAFILILELSWSLKGILGGKGIGCWEGSWGVGKGIEGWEGSWGGWEGYWGLGRVLGWEGYWGLGRVLGV